MPVRPKADVRAKAEVHVVLESVGSMRVGDLLRPSMSMWSEGQESMRVNGRAMAMSHALEETW